MPTFDIPLLRTFASVADSGGFSKAGERVNRTQSTISQQIKKLEDQAGRALLLRTARATRLTPDGERMLAYARRILALHDEARNLFAERVPELVRIGVTEDHAVESLPAALKPLLQAEAHVRLEVRCGLSHDLAAELERGGLDIALYREWLPVRPARRGADDTLLGRWPDTARWVAGAGHAVDKAGVLPLVLFPQGCIFRAWLLGQLDAMGRPWRITYCSPNSAGVLAAVRAGLGVSLLSEFMLRGGEGMRRLDSERSGLPATPDCGLVLRTGEGGMGPAAQAAASALRALTEAMVTARAAPATRTLEPRRHDASAARRGKGQRETAATGP